MTTTTLVETKSQKGDWETFVEDCKTINDESRTNVNSSMRIHYYKISEKAHNDGYHTARK